ncbi:hypothetical protein [Kingella negevensis]|uniref:hypothetical protein n=1 Tax=Kingella negevensis TaxID=1522312 RepID=UPI00050A1306|nr:hypothetical protein [Kingella negevensis]MDK4688192.1 hypothetical protein [Kingella negevensis]WII90824.1 hypothetical protein QEO93_10550 [Kingella negevensis]
MKFQGKEVPLPANFGKDKFSFLVIDNEQNLYLAAFMPAKGGTPVVVDLGLTVIKNLDTADRASLQASMVQAIEEAGYCTV